MIKKIYYWLFPEWKIIEVIQGKWVTVFGDHIHSYVVYEILYSKRLSKYKLRCSGTNWNKHPNYLEVIKTVNRLNNEHPSNSE